MYVVGELSVRVVSVLELWEAVCLITSEINTYNCSALGRCLERAHPLLPESAGGWWAGGVWMGLFSSSKH